MIKALKTITIFIVTLIVLVSIFTVFSHKVSAWTKGDRIADLYECRPEVLVEYDQEAADDPFLPVDRRKIIPMTISIRIVGDLAEHVIPGYYDEQSVIVFFNIIDKPEWCNVTIIPNIIDIIPTVEWKRNYANLTIIVNKNAPAFSYRNIKIEVRVDGLGVIEGTTINHDVHFRPGYLPILKLNTPEDTYFFTNPEDEAKFDIEIENLGNAKTHIASRVLNIPAGWNAYIEPSTVIGASLIGDTSKKNLQLVVKPPNTFGYHDEREVIQVSIIPSYYNNQ